MIMMGDRKRTVEQILGPPDRIEKKEESGASETLLACAQEAIDSAKAGDAEGFLSAIRTIFAELDQEPHKEGPHTDEE